MATGRPQKAAIRAAYIQTITSLQGSEWEYLSQAGYMSQDESDEEGGIVTKRPEYRVRWVSTFPPLLL
jgi:hypothetical protein